MRKRLFILVIFCVLIISARKMTAEISDVTRFIPLWHRMPQEGIASWYGAEFQGKEMANGKKFNRHRLTAAHRFYPLGIKLRVTNLENGENVVVTVTDRGPFVPQRVIDLSRAAAKKIDLVKYGIAPVLIQPL